MPTDVAIDQDLIDEFDSIKLDIPEGMDKETAMCIIMGCCLDMKNLIIADPAFETADQNSINFAREVMIHELLISDDRPTSVPKAMVEGKKDAQKVFDAYRNNNKEPAKAALNNIIEHHSHMIADDNASFGGNSGTQLGTNKILDIIMHEVVEKTMILVLIIILTNLLKIQQYE